MPELDDEVVSRDSCEKRRSACRGIIGLWFVVLGSFPGKAWRKAESMRELSRHILNEVGSLLDSCDGQEWEAMYQTIASSPRVLAYATGRSGFLLRTFIMRLNHLGQSAFFVGEASTPRVRHGHLFVVMSGSGSTATTLGAAREAAKHGARVAAIVGSRDSELGQLASTVLELPAPHKRGVATANGAETGQTAGSLFEQAAFLALETIILRRFQDLGHTAESALERHANLEA